MFARTNSARRRGPRLGRDVARERQQRQRWQEEAERMQAERARLATIDTGRGVCPQCGGRNITTMRRSETSSSGQVWIAGLGCCLLAPILWALIPLLSKRITVNHCVLCGYEWPV